MVSQRLQLVVWLATVAVSLMALPALGQEPAAAEAPASSDAVPAPTQARTVPFEERPYKIKSLISFSHDARISARLREDVLRRFQSHAWAYIGHVWQVNVVDTSGTLAVVTAENIQSLDASRFESEAAGMDKVFVFGVRYEGDRFLLAAREYDVLFEQWGPVFRGSAREPTQVARELVMLGSRMFSPVARLVTGDTKRVTVEIKGGRLPTLRPIAPDPSMRYRPSFQFVPNGTLFRPMRPVYNEDLEIIGTKPMGWTFYEVERREDALADCRIVSALSRTLPPQGVDPDDPQVMVTRSAGGSSTIRLVDKDNLAPLPAMDVEVRETMDSAPMPIGTTDPDGRITIPPKRSGGSSYVWVFIQHGRYRLANLPVFPGSGDEADLPLLPDAVRLDIEGRVTAVQEQIVDEVAKRTILGGTLDANGQIKGGLLKRAIDKKDWKQAQSLLAQLKKCPKKEEMAAKLDATKQYLTTIRPPDKWTGTVKRMFAETEQIIDAYFNPDEFADLVEGYEDDIKNGLEEAAVSAENQGTEPPSAAAAAPAGSS